ncbi:MAG: serine/threonine protein kinase [Myxococcales bacterium]|nr:serine/threonine protein kinase [Myxococcales bacterium]
MAGPDKQKLDPLELIGKSLLGRYTIRERLASGGMSVVYRALDERLQRPVCAKVFFGLDPEQVEYQTNYEHFVQEAFALSQLQHPNTLRIYDFGYLDFAPHSPFHVSELMGGGTLQNLVRRSGSLTPPQALAILEPVVGALSEAHGRGIVHRDIKPSNILFGAAGASRVVKLADFGIAKAQPDEQDRSIPHRARDTQAIPGVRISLYSPGWAAPEQMKAKKVGPTADVFSLGLLLAYMLTGKKIFSERNVLEALSNRIDGDGYVTEAVACLSISPEMAAVILRACRVEASERYPRAEELLGAVREAVGSDSQSPGDREATDPLLPAAAEKDEAPPGGGPVLVLEGMSDPEVVAAGRRVRLLATSAPLDLGGDDQGAVLSPARLRLTFLPGAAREARVHVKGLNCFVVREGGRPSSAVEMSQDGLLELRSAGKVRLDAVRCMFGTRGDGQLRLFPLSGVTLAVPLGKAPRSMLMDFGPGRELVLVYSLLP